MYITWMHRSLTPWLYSVLELQPNVMAFGHCCGFVGPLGVASNVHNEHCACRKINSLKDPYLYPYYRPSLQPNPYPQPKP